MKICFRNLYFRDNLFYKIISKVIYPQQIKPRDLRRAHFVLVYEQVELVHYFDFIASHKFYDGGMELSYLYLVGVTTLRLVNTSPMQRF